MKKNVGNRVAKAIELRINGEFFRIERMTKNGRHYTWAFTHDTSMRPPELSRLVIDAPPEPLYQPSTAECTDPMPLLDIDTVPVDFMKSDLFDSLELSSGDIFTDPLIPGMSDSFDSNLDCRW